MKEMQDGGNPEAENQETPNNGGGTPTEDGKVIQFPKTNVDYHTLKMGGMDDAQISIMAKKDPTIILGLAPREKSMEKAKIIAEQMGQPFNEEQFNQQRTAVEEHYANYQRGQWDIGIETPVWQRTWDSVYAEAMDPGGFVDPSDLMFNWFHEEDNRFTLDKSGRPNQVKTNQQFAEERGYYIPIVNEGDEDSGFDASKRNYKDVEINGQTARLGDLDADKNQWHGLDAGIWPGPESKVFRYGKNKACMRLLMKAIV
jgi:hypothetical protein